MPDRVLTALPVFNEEATVASVLEQVRGYCSDILVIDDGSTDTTPEILRRQTDVRLLSHGRNRGYGAALQSAFEYAKRHRYEVLVTIDCDGQHEPQRIPQFAQACDGIDIASGTRYLMPTPGSDGVPWDRQRINQIITEELNAALGLHITDAFCGFKAYRVEALRHLRVTENGYAMPLQLWCQAARLRLVIEELPVPRIYLDPNRSFGGQLDHAATRLAYYRQVIEQSLRSASFPCEASSRTPCKAV